MHIIRVTVWFWVFGYFIQYCYKLLSLSNITVMHKATGPKLLHVT